MKCVLTRSLLALLSISLLAPVVSAASPDTIILHDGTKITGEVTERGPEWVEVSGAHGAIRIRRDEVAGINEDGTANRPRSGEEPRAPDEADRPGGVQRMLVTALRLEREHRDREAKELYRRILSLDPDHELAWRGLGYLRIDGEWLTRAQLAERQGLVRHGGCWVTPEERNALVRLDEIRERAAYERRAARREERQARREERRERIRQRERELARRRLEQRYLATIQGARRSGWWAGSYFLDYYGPHFGGYGYYYGSYGWPWPFQRGGHGGRHGGMHHGRHGHDAHGGR